MPRSVAADICHCHCGAKRRKATRVMRIAFKNHSEHPACGESLPLHDHVAQFADALDANNRLIAGLERARGVRRARHDHIARQQRGEAGDTGNLLGDVMDEIRRGAARRRNILAVEREADPGVAPVELVLRDDPGAQGAGGVEALRTGRSPAGRATSRRSRR